MFKLHTAVADYKLFVVIQIVLLPLVNLGENNMQGDHLSGKPGNVREFETCQGKNLVREKCPKTVHY